jgi:hypothetical protein
MQNGFGAGTNPGPSHLSTCNNEGNKPSNKPTTMDYSTRINRLVELLNENYGHDNLSYSLVRGRKYDRIEYEARDHSGIWGFVVKSENAACGYRVEVGSMVLERGAGRPRGTVLTTDDRMMAYTKTFGPQRKFSQRSFESGHPKF